MNRISYVKGLIMKALIRGSGRSATFRKSIESFSDLGQDVQRARLIKHFLLVCYRKGLSAADLVVGLDVIVRYKRPAGMSHKVAEWSVDYVSLSERGAVFQD